MKKLFSILMIMFVSVALFSQEALKSTEEEYYDFLSLTGVVERPTLGYRTLSDSVWTYNDVESFEENEDGTFKRNQFGGGARVQRPGYPERYARELIKQTGTDLLVPEK